MWGYLSAAAQRSSIPGAASYVILRSRSMSYCEVVANIFGLVHGCCVAECTVDVSSDRTVLSVPVL